MGGQRRAVRTRAQAMFTSRVVHPTRQEPTRRLTIPRPRTTHESVPRVGPCAHLLGELVVGDEPFAEPERQRVELGGRASAHELPLAASARFEQLDLLVRSRIG